MRSVRVFLVWEVWPVPPQGSGGPVERPLLERELLPTPKVPNFDAQQWLPMSAGKLPEGQVLVDEISLSYSRELLAGRAPPVPLNPNGTPKFALEQLQFFYEFRDDGRGGDRAPRRMRFRPLGEPSRREGYVCWKMLLERASADRNSDGSSGDWSVVRR